MNISIVIPVFNEETNLDALISRCLESCSKINKPFEIILIDDGSADSSRIKIEEAAKKYPGKIVGVFLNRNYGQHAAVMAGFETSSGDVVITLDADLQNPPEEIPKLVEKMEEGFDVVGTIRKDRQDSLFRKLSSYLTNKIVQKYTGIMMHDYGCMLRAYKRNIIEAMLSCKEHSFFIPILANSFAKTTSEINVNHEKRLSGDSKYSFFKLINLYFDLLTSMSTLPLRFLTFLGTIISLFGIGFGCFLFLMRIIKGSAWAVGGVFTIFALLFILVGLQFIGMGLLGEYIGRIYNDVRSRPRYFIEKVIKDKSS
ncbi:MAG: glycosyltransferase [Desulfobacterales bacterium]|nr:glycosyltransferase [Desulfobacterales bacterium]MBF0396936.1 glycosyltransferase [Desulfobacterales bacterium]